VPASTRSSCATLGDVPLKRSKRRLARPRAYAARHSERSRGGDVAQAPAGGLPPRLPLLLVAVQLAALVERPDALERRPAHRHVRAPGVLAVPVARAEVEVRDGRVLAAAQRHAMVLEACADRPGEDAHVAGQLSVCGQQRGEPAGPHLDVVVDVDEQRRVGLARAGVAGRVQAAAAVVRDVARAVAQRRRARLAGRPVVDDEQLRARGGGLRRDRPERDVEVAGAPGGGDDDGGRGGHGGL
jgi:hypothetical protein